MKRLVTYTTAKTQDIYKKNAKICNCAIISFKPVTDFKKCVNVSCYRHYQENLMLFCG